MVTAQYTRPRTNLVELSKLYYSTEDIKRFKQEYRVERIILARQRQAAQQQQQQQQQQQAELISQQEQSENDDKAARGEDTTIQIVEENGEVSSLSSSNTPPTPSSQPSTTTSSSSHGNAYWRSKVSRRWGYGRRNSSSVRTVSPERKDVPQAQEDSTSSSSLPSSDLSQLEPLSSSLKKLLNEPERKSLSYLLDASPAYDSDDESDDDSDSSPTPAPPPKESPSSPEVGSPKSMFSSAFDHFHHGSTSTMSSRQQCLVDTLYLF